MAFCMPAYPVNLHISPPLKKFILIQIFSVILLEMISGRTGLDSIVTTYNSITKEEKQILTQTK